MIPSRHDNKAKAPDDALLEILLDPRRRLALLQTDSELTEALAAQVGWPKSRPPLAPLPWDGRILNEFLADRDDDPRVRLVQLTEQLAAERAISFTAALEAAKLVHPQLVARIAIYNAAP